MIAGLTPDLSSDLECMRQLLGRVLAAHVVAVLVLLTPPGMLAQLPDAPTPAESVQGSGNPTSEPAAIQNNLEREWTERAAAITAETLDTPTTESPVLLRDRKMLRFWKTMDWTRNNRLLRRRSGDFNPHIPRAQRIWEKYLARRRRCIAAAR